MAEVLLLFASILILCVVSGKLLYRFGVPTLLIFLVLGMLMGSDGIGKIAFDSYELAQQICSLGLIFIMFYGGFGTSWSAARPVIAPSILMSTLGVIVTAGLTGLFCHLALGASLMEGMLIGSVVASTDAASVFAILRSRNLNLKGGLASLLEVESGSNDPVSYMLTVLVITLMQSSSGTSVLKMLALQIVVGLAVGFGLAWLGATVLKKVRFEIDGLYTIFTVGAAVLAYALAETLGGNGYLSVYLVGIVIGNTKIPHKRSLVHFFDGISWLMQIMLFFTLGLLSFPSRLPGVMLAGFGVSFFMIFVARPAATFSILGWFGFPLKSQLLVSWVGLRGAASIVFAIFALTKGVPLARDLFHIVFFVALFSVAVQGTLIPAVAKKLDLVDQNSPVVKTFTDYQEESDAKLIEIPISADSAWAEKTIADAGIPRDILIVMVLRGAQTIVPKGSTVLHAGDRLVISGENFDLIEA